MGGERLLPVVEVYGPVIQGEGAMIGRQTIFVRLGLCDYRCSWCDSMFAVDPAQVKGHAVYTTASDIIEKVIACSPFCKWTTLSGGNPVLHDLTGLVLGLKAIGCNVAVETQGTVWREWLNSCDLVTVSPKPPSSGMVTNWTKLDQFLQRTTCFKVLKVVVGDEADFVYACEVQKHYPGLELFLQPCNSVGQDTSTDLLEKCRWLSEKVLNAPGNLMANVLVLPQLHTLMYGNARLK